MQRSQSRYPIQRHSAQGRSPTRRNPSLALSRSADAEDQGLFATVFRNALFGLAGFLAFGLLLVTVMCAIAYSSADPSALITPLAMAALLGASFGGGFITAKLTRTSPFLCGVICGAMCAVLMLALSLCFTCAQSSHYTFFQGLLMHAFALLFSILGAFTGNFKRKPNPRKRRFGN